MRMNWLRRFSGRDKPTDVDLSRLPEHIAIIMDGNGRWAAARGLPRTAGHAAGSEAFRRISTYCDDIGIHHLTAYAFSTENWSRPKTEVDALMALFKKNLIDVCEELIKRNAKLRIVGDTSVLSDELLSLIDNTNRISKDNTGIQINVCINYGGRAEIVRAARKLAQRVSDGDIRPEEIDDALFSANLDTAGIPDPDLIIRPSGEIRVSNFMLWESAYSEYYFTPVLWPDFDEEELRRAIADYQGRSRRYGGVQAK